MINRAQKRRQAGMSTLEFVFWCILAAGTVYGIVYAFTRGSSQSNAQALIKDFSAMAADSGQTFNGNWASFSTANADNAGIFKSYGSWTDGGGGNVALVAGGTLTVAPGTLASSNDAGQYTLTGLDQIPCKTFVTGIQGGSGSVSVNGTIVKPYGGTFSPQNMQCTSTNNTIVVTRSS